MEDLGKLINMNNNNNIIRSPTRIRITGNGTMVQIQNLSSTRTHLLSFESLLLCPFCRMHQIKYKLKSGYHVHHPPPTVFFYFVN